jgi:hypothetical protein
MCVYGLRGSPHRHVVKYPDSGQIERAVLNACSCSMYHSNDDDRLKDTGTMQLSPACFQMPLTLVICSSLAP